MITARFYVSSMTRTSYNPSHAAVTLKPAYRSDGNKAWAEATPSGEITLQVNNPAAVAQFTEWFDTGQDLHLTFAAVE
jgi:hypothetical protein